MERPEHHPRTLTDADVAALATALIKPVATEIKAQMVEDFKLDIGGMVIVWFRRAALGLIISLAVWGAAHALGYLDTAAHRRL